MLSWRVAVPPTATLPCQLLLDVFPPKWKTPVEPSYFWHSLQLCIIVWEGVWLKFNLLSTYMGDHLGAISKLRTVLQIKQNCVNCNAFLVTPFHWYWPRERKTKTTLDFGQKGLAYLLSSQGMKLMTQVQILDVTIYILLCLNAFGKVMNPSVPYSTMVYKMAINEYSKNRKM